MPAKADILLLAAGTSSRMGKNKLLLPFGETTVLAGMLGELQNTAGCRCYVITGFEHDAVRSVASAFGFPVIYNRHFEKGITSSIQAGIEHLPVDSAGAMILPADLPFVDAVSLTRLIHLFLASVTAKPGTIIAASDKGKLKNPVIFSSFYYPQILAHPIPNGCKQIVEQNREHVVAVEVNNPYFFRDIDTPADYTQLLHETAHRDR